MIKLKRVYEEPTKDDDLRILVERLWPRGFSKERAKIGLWMKDIAPSTELRKWYGHDLSRWEQFRQRYQKELELKGDLIKLIKDKCKEGTVTFIYAAHNERHNSAVALKEFIERGH